MMVAPPTGAINKSSAFTAMSHRNTRSWRSVGRGPRGGGSPGGLHPSSTYIGVPQLGLSPDGPAAGGDHVRPCLQRVEAAGWCAYLGAMAHYELTDTAWQRLEPLAAHGTPEPRSPAHPQWHSVDPPHRCPLARSVKALWPGRHGSQPVL